MELLIPIEELKNYKSRENIPLKCSYCENTFFRTKHRIQDALKRPQIKMNCCSTKCDGKRKTTKLIKCNCKQCNKIIFKHSYSIENNTFCNSACAGIYNSTHKKHGTRRSKLEIWLESQLIILYPNLEIHFNKKDTINSELDIYIPSLKLAFELNGIFHYEPIYGIEKLEKIKNNDNRKFQACIEKQINLCIIDTSSFSYFKSEQAKKYLDIIINIIGRASEPDDLASQP